MVNRLAMVSYRSSDTGSCFYSMKTQRVIIPSLLQLVALLSWQVLVPPVIGIHKSRVSIFWKTIFTCRCTEHYNDVIMGAIASQITSLAIVYSTIYSGWDQRKHQSSALLALVGGIHRTGEFPAQMASNAENVSIWWRHHGSLSPLTAPDVIIFTSPGTHKKKQKLLLIRKWYQHTQVTVGHRKNVIAVSHFSTWPRINRAVETSAR